MTYLVSLILASTFTNNPLIFPSDPISILYPDTEFHKKNSRFDFAPIVSMHSCIFISFRPPKLPTCLPNH